MRPVRAVLAAGLLLTACSAPADLSPAEAARGACDQVEDLLGSPSIDRTYPSRFGKAADTARAAADRDGRWSALSTSLAGARDAAQDVVDAAAEPGTTNTRQKALNPGPPLILGCSSVP